MLYTLTSILFFLFAFRSILFWTALWQKGNYKFGHMKQSFGFLSQKAFVLRLVFSGAILLLLFLYGAVILNDAISFWYHVSIFIFFIVGGALFLQELMQNNLMKPLFSVKSLLISMLALFLISFFYTIPLVDKYVWLAILVIITPVIVTLFVLLLGFPSEIYEDYMLQKVTELAGKNKKLQKIAFVGQDTVAIQCLSNLLEKTNLSFVESTEGIGLLGVAYVLRKAIKNKYDLFLFSIPSYREEMKKSLQLLKPQVIIITEGALSKQYEEKVRYLFSESSRNTVLLSQKGNKIFRDMAKKYHKKLVVYREGEVMRKVFYKTIISPAQQR